MSRWNIDKHGRIEKFMDTDADNYGHERVNVHNATGGTISKFTPVYLSGQHAYSGLPTIAKAKADAIIEQNQQKYGE